MSGRVKCVCPGNKILKDSMPAPCSADATQEDFLCDHCRQMDCPTITTMEESKRRRHAIIKVELEAALVRSMPRRAL